jgi:S-DNA-T family DNA segregation ATPase FtsK/SpoIIIE
MINQNDIDIATRLVVETRRASFSMLQRRMNIGYLYAERLIRELYANGVVGPVDAEGRREVLISS